MLWKNWIINTALVGLVTAFKVEDGQLKVAESISDFTCCKPLENPVVVSSLDPIELKFTVKEEGEPVRPQQVVVALKNAQTGLKQNLIPSYKKGESVLQIDVSKLSKNLLLSAFTNQDVEIDLSVIIGDFAIGTPVVKPFGALKFDKALLSKLSHKYTAPSRYSLKPEIKHIFRQPDKQTKPIVAIVFIGLIVASFLWFLGTLASHGSINLKNFKTVGEPSIYSIYKIAFVGCIIGFEVFFGQYYLGDSIFSLIGKCAVLAGPVVWFGSRVFRTL